VDSSMGLGDAVGSLENECLRGVESAEIGGPTGVFAQLDREYSPNVSERLASFVELPIGLGHHRSMPSRPISCISGVRSR
jgi:hypothetical protein